MATSQKKKKHGKILASAFPDLHQVAYRCDKFCLFIVVISCNDMQLTLLIKPEMSAP